MRRRFVLVVDRPTPAVRNQIHQALTQTGLAWAHPFADLWFLSETGPQFQWTGAGLLDLVMGVAPNLRVAVFEDDLESWAVNGPDQLFGWLGQSW